MNKKSKIIFVALSIIIILIIAVHFYLLDGLDGFIFSILPEQNTEYSSGYSDARFRKIRKGMSQEEVLNLLGKPICENWIYSKKDSRLESILFIDDRLHYIHKGENKQIKLLKLGMHRKEVCDKIGEPLLKAWGYSHSPKDMSYRVRSILFEEDKVIKIIHEFYVD